MVITAYGIPLALVTSSKYLGRVLLVADNDWPEVVRNLRKARKKWARLMRVLGTDGADARTSGHIYLAVVNFGNVVRVGDVGDELPYWEGVGRIPPQGGPQADREATSSREVQCVDITPNGGRDDGGGTVGGGDLRLPPP